MLRLIIFATLLAYCSARVPPWRTHLIPTVKEERVVGGAETTIDQVPWVVALIFKSYYVCEGVVIKPNSILTVAQCTLSPVPSTYAFRVGSSKHSSGGIVVTPSNVTRHACYTFPDFDISIFILTDNLELGTNVAVVNLPSRNQTFAVGTMAVVAGWRASFAGGSPEEGINKVEIPLVHQGFCQTSYDRNVTARMICAGTTGKGLCNNAGAPLVSNGILVGMGSWSTGCGRPGLPSVFTRVAYFIDWIEEHLEGS